MDSGLSNVVRSVRDFLGANLTGVYLHGSLATGSYHRAKSDIDLLVVVRNPVDEDERRHFALLCVSLSDRRPTMGDIELSVILERHARNFRHPLPFELHYGSDHRPRILIGRQDYSQTGTDRDLAAHCMVVNMRGVRLDDAPIREVFGQVPFEDYLDSILDDLDWILEDDNVLESPHYGVLNICRVFQVLEQGEGAVPNKKEGAEWALDSLPSGHHSLITQALECYQSEAPVSEAERRTGGLSRVKGELRAFRDYAAKRRRSGAFSAGPRPRPSSHILLVDQRDHFLLQRVFGESSLGDIWITPGGGLEAGESHEQAALRELWEETGLEGAELGPWVWTRRHVWSYQGDLYESFERFFLVRTQRFEVTPRGSDTMEISGFKEHRWWGVSDLRRSDEIFVPRRLGELAVPILAGDIPQEPIDVGV